jgi:hypothetical protein
MIRFFAILSISGLAGNRKKRTVSGTLRSVTSILIYHMGSQFDNLET